MKIGEVNTQFIRQQMRNHRIICPGNLDASFIVSFRTIQIMSRIQSFDGIEHCYVGYMTSWTSQHIVQTRQEPIKPGQTRIIE